MPGKDQCLGGLGCSWGHGYSRPTSCSGCDACLCGSPWPGRSPGIGWGYDSAEGLRDLELEFFVREEIPAGTQSNRLGTHPSGYLNDGCDCRVIVIIAGRERQHPAAAVPTPREVEALMRGVISCEDTDSLDAKANTLTHDMDGFWNQTYTTKALVRPTGLKVIACC